MEKHLPATHLPHKSRAMLAKELVKACSLTETQSLANLPISNQRAAVAAKIAALGAPLQRSECVNCLTDLALVVPRAGLDADGVERMCDLYFGLLREKGVTKPMLMAAAKAFVMAPKKGKPKFFPDPGELYELCADEAARRGRALEAFNNALAVLDGRTVASEPEAEPDTSPEMLAKLRDLATNLSTKPGAVMATDDAPKTKAPVTSRPCTDPAELKAALNKRLKQQAA